MIKIGINALFLRKLDTGIGRSTKNLIEELEKLDRENLYYLYTDHKLPIKLSANFRTKIVSSSFYRREDLIKQTFWEKISLVKEAEKDQLDIFFSPYNSASRFKTIPNIVLLHDVIWKVLASTYLYNFRRKIYAQQTYEAVKSAKRVLTVSEFSKKEIIKYLGVESENIKVIGGGVSPMFKPVEKNNKKLRATLEKFRITTPYIFYMGGFEIRKNVSLLLRAFSKLAKHYSANLKDTILVIGGETPPAALPLLEDVRGITESLGMNGRIKFVGKLTDEELISFYNGAEFFVFPSLYEGFGLTVLEAMACGTPVIASQIGSVKEVAQDTVYYFHPEREDELVQTMNKFLTDAITKEELRVRALNRSRQFTWDKPGKLLWEELKNNAKIR